MTVSTIGKVILVQPIEGADRIEAAQAVCGRLGKWSGVIEKGSLSTGDLCEVYLQDCIVPQTPRFAFMEKHKYIVKMCRFKKVPSECLILPLTVQGDIGDDIDALTGCTKYEKPLPANMAGDARGNFPHFIPKTDEPNFQSVPDMVQALVGHAYYTTEKEDGSSATVYWHEGHFGCCSRNIELEETPSNAIWQIARKYDLETLLSGEPLALQFECVGPGIQGNPMGLKQVEPRLFNVYDIDAREYWNGEQVSLWAILHGFPMVAWLFDNEIFSIPSNDGLQTLAEGLYPNGKQREGIVIRPMEEMRVNGDRLSFKVVSLRYKA